MLMNKIRLLSAMFSLFLITFSGTNLTHAQGKLFCSRSSVSDSTDKEDIFDFDADDRSLFVESFYIPSFSVWPDKDSDEVNDGIEFNADLSSGYGIAVKIGIGTEQENLGFVYITTDHNETITHNSSRMYGYFLEAGIHQQINNFLFIEGAIGIGGIHFDLPSRFDNSDGLAGMLRLNIGVSLFDHLRLNAGAGFMRWGHPGETYANSGFSMLGAAFLF